MSSMCDVLLMDKWLAINRAKTTPNTLFNPKIDWTQSTDYSMDSNFLCCQTKKNK